MDYNEIVRSQMGEKRYTHSVEVARQAVHLAKIWGADEEKAHLAGLVHDICKEWSKSDMLKHIGEHDIILDKITLKESGLWHGIIGSVYIQKIGIVDEEIISAVRYHTSGRAKMTILDKIIYLADLTSADRDYPEVDYMRELCNTSLDRAMYEALQFIMGDLIRSGMAIVKDTYKAYNYYLDKHQRNGGTI